MENKYNELEKLNQLKSSGTITEEEFEMQKSKILNSKSNITHTEFNKSKIFYILVGIGIVITIIVSIFSNQSYKEYWNNWEINSTKYRILENKWEIFKNTTIISILITDLLFIVGSIVQFIKTKDNKRTIIIISIGLVIMIIFTIGCIFLSKLN